MRRYLIITIAIIAVIIVVVAILFIRSRNGAITPSPDESGSLPDVGLDNNGGQAGNQSGELPAENPDQSSASKFGLVFGEPVLNYFAATNNTVTAIEPDGKIAQIANGGSTYLSSSAIANVAFADFSYDGKKVLVGFGTQTNLQWSLFDVTTKAWSPVTISATSAAWSPNNYQVAYFTSGANGVSLQTLDLGNSKAKPKVLFSMPNQDFMLQWPTTSTILISDRPSAYFSGSVFAFNLKTATLATVVKSRVGLDIKWNTAGSTGIILAGTKLARGGQLGIIDGAGNFLHLLSFLTLPSKCVFPSPPVSAGRTSTSSATSSSQTTAVQAPQLICAIPRNSSDLQSNPLPDAYLQKLLLTSDGVYGVSLADGTITTLFNDRAQNLDISLLKFANNTVFFVNRYDQKLYAISL